MKRLDFLYIEENSISGTLPPEYGKLAVTHHAQPFVAISSCVVRNASGRRPIARGDIPQHRLSSTCSPLHPRPNLHNSCCCCAAASHYCQHPQMLMRQVIDFLSFDNTMLSGTIPPQIGKLDRLKDLDLDFTQ